MRTIRTDLAVEAHEYYTEGGKHVPQGVEMKKTEMDGCSITRVRILSEQGETALHKPQGEYITIEIRDIMRLSAQGQEAAGGVLGRQIRQLLEGCGISGEDEILVIGLGNWDITPDALGPKTISKLVVTRHLLEYMPEVVEQGTRSVCAMSPGVLGITGIETGEIVKGLVERVKPKAVIAIDALASRSTERVGVTVQLSDTGISPGSGIGNRRKELTRRTLGIPVIAIGVPMVVDAATIADDALDAVIEKLGESADKQKPFYEMLKSLEGEERYELIRQSLGKGLAEMIVTPKEVDAMIEESSSVLSDGINKGIYSSEFLRQVS